MMKFSLSRAAVFALVPCVGIIVGSQSVPAQDSPGVSSVATTFATPDSTTGLGTEIFAFPDPGPLSTVVIGSPDPGPPSTVTAGPGVPSPGDVSGISSVSPFLPPLDVSHDLIVTEIINQIIMSPPPVPPPVLNVFENITDQVCAPCVPTVHDILITNEGPKPDRQQVPTPNPHQGSTAAPGTHIITSPQIPIN